MKTLFRIPILLLLSFVFFLPSVAQSNNKALPVFENGEAQIVPAFEEREDWIRHDLWVETEFDTDGDQKPDRMHVAVTRPKVAETTALGAAYAAGLAGFLDDADFATECVGCELRQDSFHNLLAILHQYGLKLRHRANRPTVGQLGRTVVLQS